MFDSAFQDGVKRPGTREMTALLAKTTNASVAGQYEKYKTSTMFDGTVHNPQYLG